MGRYHLFFLPLTFHLISFLYDLIFSSGSITVLLKLFSDQSWPLFVWFLQPPEIKYFLCLQDILASRSLFAEQTLRLACRSVFENCILSPQCRGVRLAVCSVLIKSPSVLVCVCADRKEGVEAENLRNVFSITSSLSAPGFCCFIVLPFSV